MSGDDRRLLRVESRALVAGALAGTAAGVPMGLLFQFGTDVLPVLGSFLGAATVVRGWIVHLLIGLVYGAVFAAILAYPPVQDFAPTVGVGQYVLVAVTYAVMVAAVTIGLLPFVLELPWETAATDSRQSALGGPGFGGLAQTTVFAVAHVVYGVVLGVAYVLLGGGTTDEPPGR